MKKYLYITLAAFVGLSSATLTSCSGESNDEPTTDPSTTTAITLTVDKPTIEANNSEVATFKVVNQDGVDITTVKGTTFMNNSDNSISQVPTVTAFENGAVSYNARFNGIRSNVVTVTGANRKNYEKYYRKIAVFQATGTWCVNCPGMGEVLSEVEKNYLTGRMVRMTFHQGTQGQSDPFEVPQTQELFNGGFGINGYPSGVVDMRKGLPQMRTAPGFASVMKESMRDYPATCGIRINSAVSGNVANVTTEITFDKAGKYSIAGAILVDNLKADQAGADKNYRHNNTVRAIFGSSKGALVGGLIGTKEAGSTYSQPFTITLNANEPIEDTRVVIYVLKEDTTGKFYVNNVAVCPVVGSVDYKLND
ncbi:MAG: Omp28-related outer membrane protein [Alistipes sp.]